MSMRFQRALPMLALLCAPSLLRGQSLADRVRAVHDGDVELRFAGRRGLCGDGEHYLSFGGHYFIGETTRFDDDQRPCLPGPVRVRLRVEHDVVRDVRAWVGPLATGSATQPSVDLGAVPAAEAGRYFLALASQGEGRAAQRSVMTAVLADSLVVWPDLVRLARDSGRPRVLRNDAAFWLSRFAGARIAGHAEDLGEEDAERKDRDDPRLAAVFALSQLRNGEGIAPLVETARTNRNLRVRQQALFWLSQSGDPRGVAVMEEILRGSNE